MLLEKYIFPQMASGSNSTIPGVQVVGALQVHSGSAAAAKSLQSCSTLRDPIDGSPPGSPVPGILQARTLEWAAISFGFPGGSDSKASACSAGDPASIPGVGRSSAEGNGNPLQYSCLENFMDRGAWSATAHGVAKSRTRLSNFTFSNAWK